MEYGSPCPPMPAPKLRSIRMPAQSCEEVQIRCQYSRLSWVVSAGFAQVRAQISESREKIRKHKIGSKIENFSRPAAEMDGVFNPSTHWSTWSTVTLRRPGTWAKFLMEHTVMYDLHAFQSERTHVMGHTPRDDAEMISWPRVQTLRKLGT